MLFEMLVLNLPVGAAGLLHAIAARGNSRRSSLVVDYEIPPRLLIQAYLGAFLISSAPLAVASIRVATSS